MLVGPRHYREVAEIAEELGFASVHVPDHLVYPAAPPTNYPYTDDGTLSLGGEEIFTASLPCYDPFGLLSYLAACTETVQLVPSVCVVPLYHPLFLARALATVDRLSGGRVALGVGVGWLAEEFAAAGESFGDRGRRTDAIIDLLRRLWREDVIEQHDAWHDFGPVRFNPKPLNGAIPLYVGGDSKPALRRAAAHGDGWLDIGSKTLDDVIAKLNVIRRLRVEAGREQLPFEVMVTSNVAPDLDTVRRAAEHGVSRIIALPDSPEGRPSAAAARKWAEAYHDEVMARV